MVEGRCLCGGVSFEVTGELGMAMHCHCSMCRKFHGTPFGTHGAVSADGLRWRSGRDLVRRHESSPGGGRPFCARCGSNVPVELPGGVLLVPLGNLEGDPGTRPIAHIFVASKAGWYDIAGDLPRFDEYPPGLDASAVATPERPSAPAGRLGGSCLCNRVAYEIDGDLDFVRHCHCSRCRRARSAAHATNGFLAAERFRFVRGEDEVESFKVPDAERFAQNFCGTCGSAMPRSFPGRPYVVVPMGGLDDVPRARPSGHIFAGSKAPWFEIADDLPQHVEYPPA